MNNWNPRQEIILAAHRWYWIAASFLLGALLGWMISFIWPAPYRATMDLYVGLNANRAMRDLYIAKVAQESFENLDDFKHWQMSQFNALAMSDEYLGETLRRLQTEDATWQDMDVPALRKMLSVSWRNTGEWHFSAQAKESDISAHLVGVWSGVVLEKANESIAAARQLIIIDSELNAIDQTLVSAEYRRNLLTETQKILEEWVEILNIKTMDQPLLTSEHWSLLAQVAIVTDWNPGWITAFDAAPLIGSLPSDYLLWLNQVNALIDAELARLPSIIDTLEVEHKDLSVQYDLAADQSRALSGNLEVSQIKDEPPNVISLRPTGTLMLIGGLLGLLAWMMGWLVQITRKTK